MWTRDTTSGRCVCADGWTGGACEISPEQRQRTLLLAAGVTVLTLLCLAAGGVVAYGRYVLGLSLRDDAARLRGCVLRGEGF